LLGLFAASRLRLLALLGRLPGLVLASLVPAHFRLLPTALLPL